MEGLGADVVRIVTISVNGESTETGGAVTIADLIERYQLAPQAVLIEHNGVALHRR